MVRQGVLICAGATASLLGLLAYSSWRVLEPWEMGLDYSMISKTISDAAWGAGRHYIGVGHSFYRFNSTVTTVQFSHIPGSSSGPLRSRTADGLEVALEISFQYRLLQDSLYELYTTYGPDYHSIFTKMGMDLLTVAATKHDARSFFVNRTLIGNLMELSLRKHFQQTAKIEIPLFQLQAISLPRPFEEAIKSTQVAEQKIKRVSAEQKMRVVEYETQVIQAQRYVKVRQQQAEALVQSIHLRNNADIAAFNASQLRTAAAFKRVLETFDGNTDRLLKYMKVRAMRDHPSEHSILGIKDDIDMPPDPKFMGDLKDE